MIRADALKSENYPVRKEITGLKQIMISHTCSTENTESKNS